jgi:parallel beta-helix repeat protein
MCRTKILTILVVVLFVTQVCCYGGPIIYVDVDANGINDGTSWDDAYTYLQDALADANSAEKPVEIRVAQGMYRPDRSSTEPNGTGDRTATFQLINGVTIKGGYAGPRMSLSGADPNARDIEFYETILSGDLNGDDIEVSDPCYLSTEPTRAENSYHVVTGSGTEPNAILEGFTITGGNANVFNVNDSGGGMYNYRGSPTIRNCTFSSNSAGNDSIGGGGGMYNMYSSPTLTNCTFSGNSAYHGDSVGGGMSNGKSSPTLTNCTFSRNSGGIMNWYGSSTLVNCTFIENTGGIHHYGSNLTLTNCTFRGNNGLGMGGWGGSYTLINCIISRNLSSRSGGGFWNNGGDVTLTNCTFSGNLARDTGGGMYNKDSSPRINNCTFTGNSAETGGGIYNKESNPRLSNCILWANSSGEIFLDDKSSASIVYSDVQGGWKGLGNIDAEPMFVDSGRWEDANDPNIIVEPNDPNASWFDGDYHLKSEGWRWDTQRKVWTWDDVTSPCIDAGNPGCALGNELLSVPDDPNNEWGENLRINMGAYGGTVEASMALPGWALLADLTNDGIVDFNDLAVFVEYWLDSGHCIPGDLNRNESVDFADFALMGFDWLEER